MNLPAELDGAEYIRTACDSKNYTETLGSFTANADTDIYIAIDSRVNPIPDWLTQWEKTSLSFVSSNNVTFELYKKNFKKDENVTLGSNGQSANCVNYVVLAMAEKKETVKGDVNSDGAFNAADIVMMQKCLLCAGNLTDWKAGDLFEDNIIDSFDLCLMRKLLIQ